MRIGLSDVDITPPVGAELSGFAARQQPSTHVLDPLHARALHVVDEDRRLLWVHCDLIGLDGSWVDQFRNWCQKEHGLGPEQVMLSATHTHSGPATVHLEGAGGFDPDYGAVLLSRLRGLSAAALARTEPVELALALGSCDLAIDRRRRATGHTDPRVAALGFRRADGTYAAVLLHCAIHPVALGASNRGISGDVLGQASAALAARLPGRPSVFALNGACANLNPPALDVAPSQVAAWGARLADAIAPVLEAAPRLENTRLLTARQVQPLPLDRLRGVELDAWVERERHRPGRTPEQRARYEPVLAAWARRLHQAEAAGEALDALPVEHHLVRFGPCTFLGINAELFSRSAAALRQGPGDPLFIVGYANGVLGYLCPRETYAEGGYEVEAAHVYYGRPRFRAGAAEAWLETARALRRKADAGHSA